jgi:hypothetical protein
MRRAGLVAAVVLASSVALAPRGEAADAAEPLLGRWESVTRSTGGLGQIIELRADGTMTQWIAALVELTYKLQGLQLTTTFRAPSGTTEVQSMTIRFEGDVMIQHDARSGAESTLTRKRAGGAQDPPIVGVWTMPHETGPTAFFLYTPNGRVVFRLPIRADRGRWSTAGDQLTLGPGLGDATTVRYEMLDGQLVLHDGQIRRVYTRAEIVEYP